MKEERMASTGMDDKKRKWADLGWEVVFEAHSFVALMAAEPEEAPKAPSKGKTYRKGKKKSSSRRSRKNDKSDEDASKDIDMTPTASFEQGFYVVQLQDDVTEDMLDTDEEVVRVTWLGAKAGQAQRYERQHDEAVNVGTIMCQVYMIEHETNNLELTAKSKQRAEICLQRSKVNDEEGIPMPSDIENEKPPTSGRKKSGMNDVDMDEDSNSDGDGEVVKKRRRVNRGSSNGSSKVRRKLTKKEASMITPPLYTSVDETKYEDKELFGMESSENLDEDDVMANDKELIRAVLTGNHELLKTLTENKHVYKKLHTFHAYQSADVHRTAFQCAIEKDDSKAISLLVQAHKMENPVMAAAPDISLPSHSTGSHTSRFSDYNRRAINASRGGKEGNDALLNDNKNEISQRAEYSFLWRCNRTSIQALTLVYPTGEWTSEYHASTYVAQSARVGNYRLVERMIQTLARKGGWGFNDLHHKVLSSSGEELPAFRNVSVIKQAQDSKLRPLHLACINPDIQYLKTLWGSDGAEWAAIKDVLQYEPIHYAAACEGTGPLEFLLEHKCSLFARTKHRETPLMRAIECRREENALVILEYARKEDDETLQKVLSERGNRSQQAIHMAASNGCNHLMEKLIEFGAAVNSAGADKITPLCLASMQGHIECAKLLLDNGAKVNQGNKLKKTPLMFAVKNGHTKLAAMLINYGANVNALDTSDNSVAHYAAAYGYLSCVQLLCDVGANVWLRNSWGIIPLSCALLKQRLQCSNFIFEQDTTNEVINFRDRNGCTMLFLQCQHSKNVSQLKYLLNKGLDPNIPNLDGIYPLQCLIDRAKVEARKGQMRDGESFECSDFYMSSIRLLLQHGGKVTYDLSPNEDKSITQLQQPLEMTITEKLKSLFDLLLDEFNADPAAMNNRGIDSWMVALGLGREGEYYVQKLLKKHTSQNGQNKLPMRLRSTETNSNNIFHCIATGPATKLVSSELVETFVDMCPDPAGFFNAKNEFGFSPLIQLLSNQRHQFSREELKDSSEAQLVADLQSSDSNFSKLVEIFARETTDVEAAVLYQSRPRFETIVSNDVDMNETAAGKAEPVKVRVLTVLHLAFTKGFTTSSSENHLKWFGPDLVTVLVQNLPDLVNNPKLLNLRQEQAGSFKTALHIAVANESVDSVRALVQSKANPNISSVGCQGCIDNKWTKDWACPNQCELKKVETALIAAVRSKKVDNVRLLLGNRADVKCYTETNWDSPLHIALAANAVEITELLLEYDAQVVEKNVKGETALHAALAANNTVTERKPHEGQVAYTPLEDVTEAPTITQAREKTAIEVFLEHPLAKPALAIQNVHGHTPIHIAASKRDTSLLRFLVNGSENVKESVNVNDVYGRSPLHLAVNAASMDANASFETERFLLQCHADANALDYLNFTPLHYAMFKVDMHWSIRYDMQNQKQKQDKDDVSKDESYEKKKKEAFDEILRKIPAKSTDPVETVANLVAVHSINLGQKDKFGRTPLHLAAATGAFVCASSILAACKSAIEKKDLLEAEDERGFTPLGLAFLHLQQQTITTLLDNGASFSGVIKVDEMDKKGNGENGKVKKVTKQYSYFYHAVKHGLTGVCHMLLNAKFDRRQAVEDAILCSQFQLANNLIVSVEFSNDTALLTRVNDRQETLLHSMAKVTKSFGDFESELAWTLIDAGVDAKQQTEGGNTALHYAARAGNIHFMDFLQHNGCDISARNALDETVTLYMIKHGRDQLEAKLQKSLTYCASRSNSRDEVDKSGTNIIAAYLDRMLNQVDSTPKQFVAVEAILKRGSNADCVFPSQHKNDLFNNEALGCTSLKTKMPVVVLASYTSHKYIRYQLVAMLLRYGARVCTADEYGNSLLTHLVVRNLVHEVRLVLGLVKNVLDPTDEKNKRVVRVQVRKEDIKRAVKQKNKDGKTALHYAVQSQSFCSYENVEMIQLILDAGGDLMAKDLDGSTPVDLASKQRSGHVMRYLKSKYPSETKRACNGAIELEEDEEMWEEAPGYMEDAQEYLRQCEVTGKIKKERSKAVVDRNCNAGNKSRVVNKLDASGEPLPNEAYSALLTKVDVKNGRFGLNVFYKLQLVEDQLQGIFVLFTNWGRIGEEGKFQNTPFQSEAEGITEFKKVFRSKTGNHWEQRHEYVKQPKKYNLVQRVQTRTTINAEVTRSIVETAKHESLPAIKNADCATPQLTQLLSAIADVRNLEIAAQKDCRFSGNLPLADQSELIAAVEHLESIKGLLKERIEVNEKIQACNGDMSDEGHRKLTDLSNEHAALTDEISEKSSRYYEIMPQNEDSSGDSIRGFDDESDVNAEITRLRTLMDISQTYKILLGAKQKQKQVHPLEYCYQSMQVHISPMDADSEESKVLSRYFFNGIRPKKREKYRVSNIFSVSRKGEKSRMKDFLEQNPSFADKHSKLFWHGTSRTNVMGILSQGLRIAPPEAPRHGCAYGKGLYFADVAKKSLGYCGTPYIISPSTLPAASGTVNGNALNKEKTRQVCYLLLCEVLTGNPEERSQPLFNSEEVPKADSVRALAEHLPNPEGSITSPVSGTEMDLGEVGKVGHAVPYDSLWASCPIDSERYMMFRHIDYEMTERKMRFLDKALAQCNEGESVQLEDEDEKRAFVNYEFHSASVELKVLEKAMELSQGKNTKPSPDRKAGCDATVQVIISENDCIVKYYAKRYRSVRFQDCVLPEEYRFCETCRSGHSEHIVYNEAQARIRYLVEVELLKNKSYWN